MFKREKKPKPWEVEENEPMPIQDSILQEEHETDGQEPVQTTPQEMDYGDLISTALQKQKKKRNPKTILILCIAGGIAVLLLFQVIWNSLQGPPPTYAEIEAVSFGSITQTLSSSGPVKSADVQTVFSTASAPISELNVTVGEIISAGERLVSFDTEELMRSVETAGASVNQVALQQQQSEHTSAEAAQTAQDYRNGATTMRQQRDVASINLTREQENLAAVTATVTPTLAAKKTQLDSLRTQQTSLLTSDSAAAVALQPQIDALATEVSALEGQLSAAQAAVAAAQSDVEYHNSLVSQLDNAAEQAESGVLDSNALAQMQTQMVAPENSLETAREQLTAAQEGITAPISGVVTEVQVSQGGMAQQYSPICVIQSLSDVVVQLSLSHYDLEQVRVGQSAVITLSGKEYNGTVSSIDQMATEQTSQNGTSSFVGAKVTIENPDDNITLGLDATAEILTGEVHDVLTVPTTAINTDVDGTYVMLAVDDVAVRRSVETGLSSDTTIEVLSGLAEGDMVILSSQDITEGSAVSNDPAYNTQTALSPMMTM